jgi:hypothetical protein
MYSGRMKCFFFANRVKYLNYFFYCRWIREDSITRGISFATRGGHLLEIYCEILTLYKKVENNNKRIALNDVILRNFFYVICQVPFSEQSYRSFLKNKRDFLLKIDSSICCYLALILLLTNTKFFVNLYKLLTKINNLYKYITQLTLFGRSEN